MTDTARLRTLINGYRISQAIHVAAALGISDLLVDGPRSVEDLATAAEADVEALRRVLRALAADGVYVEDDRGWFGNNDVSSALCNNVPGSLGTFASFIGQVPHWSAWGQLLHTVRTGENAFAHLYGTDVWTYRAQRPEESAVFDAWMAANTESIADAVVAAYDFGEAVTVVDVAGGTGALIGAVLKAHPEMSGVLFEQSAVIERAAQLVTTQSWAQRCRLVAGSMFETVPAGGDVYLLKSILHDWSDTEAEAILARCRDAMSGQADPPRMAPAPGTPRLLILERLLDGPNRGPETKFSDLNMMVMLGGRERSSQEFAELCRRAGLRLRRTLPTGTPWYVLEAISA